jgi:AraC-like DNA-binding protein
MSKVMEISFDELSPYICKAGKQNSVPWKNRFRKIYDHEFIYCSSGKAHVLIENREYQMNPGSLILIKPNVPHSFWKDEEAPGEQYWVHFDYVYRKDVYSLDKFITENNTILFEEMLPLTEFIREDIVFENGFSFPEFIEINQSKLMEDLFEKLIFCFEQHKTLWQMECKVYLLQIFNCILHQMNVESTNNTAKSDNHIVKIITQYIFKNYFRKIYLSEISNMVRLSEDYIGRVFKKYTGMTIIAFISHLRLEKAKDLLSKTDLTIENISEMVGYNDVFYFSKVMKKSEGLSPREWRKAMRSS